MQSNKKPNKAPNTLYWFTHDLRLNDNPALSLASDSEKLHLLYCVNPRSFAPLRYQLAQMGSKRWSFIRESLEALQDQLNKIQQYLHVAYWVPTST